MSRTSPVDGPPHRDRSTVALAAALTALLLLLAAGAFLLPGRGPSVAAMVTPEHIDLMGLLDSGPQKRFHQLLLALTALLLLAVACLRNPATTLAGLSERLEGARALWRRLGLVVPPALILLALPGHNLKDLLGGTALALLVVFLSTRWGHDRWFGRLTVVGVVVYALVTILPGFLITPDLAKGFDPSLPSSWRPGDLHFAEWHYSIVVSQGDRLSQGLRLFEHIAPHYGLLGPFLLGLGQKLWGLLSWGEHIRVVQFTQVVYAAAALASYLLWNRRRWLSIAVAFLPTMATVHTLHMSVLHYPNQSGWRLAGLPLGVLLLLALRPAGIAAGGKLGLAFGLLVALNPETAMAVGIGYLAFLLTELYPAAPPRRWVAVLLTFGASAAAMLVLFAVTVRLVFGHWPLPAPGGGATTLARFLSGYGGIRLQLNSTWLMMLAHPLFELVRLGLQARHGLDLRQRLRAALAAMLLVWFGYFLNMPTSHNLWTVNFLYGFFLMELLTPAALERYREEVRRRRLPLGLAMVMVFLVANVHAVLDAGREGISALRPGDQQASTVLSDVRLPSAYAELVRRKANFVQQRAATRSLYYCTASMYSVPLLSGRFPQLPVADCYSEAFTNADVDLLVSWIERHAPAELLFDDPAAGWDGPPSRQRFMARLKQRLAGSYYLGERGEGWEVWARR